METSPNRPIETRLTSCIMLKVIICAAVVIFDYLFLFSEVRRKSVVTVRLMVSTRSSCIQLKNGQAINVATYKADQAATDFGELSTLAQALYNVRTAHS